MYAQSVLVVLLDRLRRALKRVPRSGLSGVVTSPGGLSGPAGTTAGCWLVGESTAWLHAQSHRQWVCACTLIISRAVVRPCTDGHAFRPHGMIGWNYDTRTGDTMT